MHLAKRRFCRIRATWGVVDLLSAGYAEETIPTWRAPKGPVNLWRLPGGGVVHTDLLRRRVHESRYLLEMEIYER
jgi:hypothetical protein